MPPATNPHFRVSPQVLGPLGAEQLQDPALAILELIKNAWDADATRVAIRVDQKKSPGQITIVDNGHGMKRLEFEDRWLVIGASYKRGAEKSEGQRPLIGEKGLGRLASFALGNSITIKSARKAEEGFVAEVNWESLRRAKSLEDYEVGISPEKRRKVSSWRAILGAYVNRALVEEAEEDDSNFMDSAALQMLRRSLGYIDEN